MEFKMKKHTTVILFLFFWITTNAQVSIRIVEEFTMQGISDVQVTGTQLYISNQKGEVVIQIPEEKLRLEHPDYLEKTLTWSEIKGMNFIISLKSNVNTLEETVVSASRFQEKKKDVVQKIQVLRASEIQQMNQTSTADVLANSGNVMVQKSQLGGGSPIIRGFETNKVLIVIDGVRMNNAIYRGGHLQNVITLDNSIMDRVELVFGPGSVVYGSDALGGVMSFKTKDPLLSKEDKPLVKANAYSRYMSAVNGYAAHANVSVGGKRLGSLTSFTVANFGDLRQGANREIFVGNFGARSWYQQRFDDKDSMVFNPDSNIQVGSGYSQYDFLQKFLFQQSDKLKHLINLQYSISSNVPRYDRLTLMNNGLPRFAEWYYGPQKRLFTSYQLEINKQHILYDFARLTLGYQQIEESRFDRKFNSTSLNQRIEDLNIYTLNVDLMKKMGSHEIRYGLEGWYNGVASNANSEDIISGISSPLNTRYASGGSSMYSGALYATHAWEINEKLVLNDGIRFSYVALNAIFSDTIFFAFPFEEVNQRNQAMNGNLGVVYQPEVNTRVSFLLSTGFRAPNVDDLSKVFESTPGNLIVPNEQIKPEFTYNGELGISHTFDQKWTISGTGYYTLFRNALMVKNYKYNGQDSILFDGVLSNVVAMQNERNAYLYGLELALNGKLTKEVLVYASYNYTYARIKTDSVAIPLDHIPPSFGKFGITITDRKFKGDFFVQYSGWKRIEEYNPFGEDNQAYALPEGMPSWYTINARLSYQFSRYIGLQLACENILDRNYRVFASNISAPGRNFILTLRGSF
jgi:hemoglobin/transferrin/lactoferrin receptor protein